MRSNPAHPVGLLATAAFAAVAASAVAVLPAGGFGPAAAYGELRGRGEGVVVDGTTGRRGVVVDVRTGRRALVEVTPVPERHNARFLEALRHDVAGRHEKALDTYQLAARMGHCANGSRCAWHKKLTEEILDARRAVAGNPTEYVAHNNLAITCANKLIALRIDVGGVPEALRAEAERHYRVARDLAPPSGTNEVLLGLAALYGEIGEEDRARHVFRGVRLDELESSTGYGNLAYFLTTIGELDQAFEMLEKALLLDGPDGHYRTWALESDDYHRVRNHPRFKEILDLY